MKESIIVKIKQTILKYLPLWVYKILIEIFINIQIFYTSKKKKLTIKKHGVFFDIQNRKNKCIRISRKHKVYLPDIINSFKYYSDAVKPINVDGISLIDYSTPRYHEVNGYDLHPIIFPSFAEPVSSTQQYLKFAQLKSNSIVLDLGAYSGLTSILFDQSLGENGQVIAVEADRMNIICIKKNFQLYKRITGRVIRLLEGVVWENNQGLIFSNEGNLGSSATSIVGQHRGTNIKTLSFTLSTIAKKFHLKKIDFIKCDIEGGESIIFRDKQFFNTFQPKIIIETHIVNKRNTIQECIDQLSTYGYRFKKIIQRGVDLPLLGCTPK